MSEILTLYPHILSSLQSMTGSEWDSKAVADAFGLLKYLQSTQFVTCFVIAEHILGYTKQLSKKLQGFTIWLSLFVIYCSVSVENHLPDVVSLVFSYVVKITILQRCI